MAANLPYLKGVRTRYLNSLNKEVFNGLALLQSDIELIDKEECIRKINKCIERLEAYSDKLENQTDKVAEAIGETDAELTQQLINENQAVCDEAMECILNLQELKMKMTKPKVVEIAETEVKKDIVVDQVVQLQKEMQNIVTQQMQQQQALLAKQELKEKEQASTVKLPKLDMISFSGDKLRWVEFWDSFVCAVHKNAKLSDIEKFSYLKSKLTGEANSAISGLSLSNENYQVAIGILQERFGDVQEVVDLHYNQMINLSPATMNTNSLRSLLDNIERHLRSLEVLNQNINQDVFVSMIRAKLPEEVLLQLEIINGAKNKWTISKLRDKLREYVTAREKAEKKNKPTEQRFSSNNKSSYVRPKEMSKSRQNSFPKVVKNSWTRKSSVAGSAEALVANTKQNTVTRHYDQCRYCDKRHWSDECPKYKSIEERKQQLKDSCYRCLKVGHVSKECKRTKTCVYCGEVNVHHRSLCPKKFRSSVSSVHLSEEISDVAKESSTVQENVLVSSGELVLMQTAKTEIKHPLGSRREEVRILMDSGSQRTYVTERLAEKLGLMREDEQEIKLVTFGSEHPKTIKTTLTKLSVKLNNGEYLDISANIVPVISGSVQRKAIKLNPAENIEHLIKSLDMADTIPTDSESSSVELLIGNDYYLDIILSQKIEVQPGLYLLASKLGWILTGRTNECDSEVNETNMLILTYGTNITKNSVFTNVDKTIPVKPDLEDFWNIETIGVIDNAKTTNDDLARLHFKETLKFEDGRYQVTWPWKEESPDLPLNRDLALGRLKSTISRMKNKPDLMKKYDSIIQDQLDKGVIEKVTDLHEDGPKHYLPHHAVINPLKATTNLRVVYDASAKTKKENNSLNDCLYRGPVLLNDLCGMLMRFRLHNIAIVADIEKAFLQIGLQPSQREVTMFLWLKDNKMPTVNDCAIQEYRFCRVPFGVISSPFLLGSTIESHLASYDSELANKLKHDIYVDNLITGTTTIQEALQLYSAAKSIFKDASMNLREWVSNNDTVNEIIETNDRAVCETMSVLGHSWNVYQDTISLKSINVPLDLHSLSKRVVLKQLASVFDPLGLFAPVLLKGKVFLQTLWNKRLNWDDKIEADDCSVWSSIHSDLTMIFSCSIDRCVSFREGSKSVNYKLLCFCDASAYAYAAVVFLHQTSTNSESKSDLIFSKTRLAPLKGLTIPRLELMAVLIGVRCVTFVKDQLHLPIEHTYLWTDSQCVLRWIRSNKDLSVFVRNRVNEISEHGNITFSYVSTKQNPADTASRGTTLKKLMEDQLWWHGPKWLTKPESEWSHSDSATDRKTEIDFESELRIQKQPSESGFLDLSEKVVKLQTCNSDTTSPLGIDSERYSSFTKMLRVTALALRFIKKLRKSDSDGCTLTNSDLDEAKRMWIRHVQRKHYPEVYEAISGKCSNNLQKQLGLYIDDDGILRCKGRIEHADLSESMRHPILLPKKERFTHLLIEKSHKETLHSGVSQTLSCIRHTYWIPHGRATVRSVLRNCSVCRRHEGGPYKMPTMSPLPKGRVTEAVPFSRTGVDYLGPLFIKTKEGAKKVWICLFTCLVIRAVHLELMQDMSTAEFLLGFRRFISKKRYTRRGNKRQCVTIQIRK